MNTNRRIPEGQLCEHCEMVPATTRMVMDDTGFGDEPEYGYYCHPCREAIAERMRVGTCEWCRRSSTDLRWVKDWSEGIDASLYQVCGNCDRSQQHRIERDLKRSEYFWD